MLPVLKAGDTALWDNGDLTVVKVESIKLREGGNDHGGRPSSDHLVTIVVKHDTRSYRKGERFTDVWGLRIVPRSAMRRHRYSTTIGPYFIQLDGQHEGAEK